MLVYISNCFINREFQAITQLNLCNIDMHLCSEYKIYSNACNSEEEKTKEST